MYEPLHEKTNILHISESKDADQLPNNCEDDQHLCFWTLQFLYFPIQHLCIYIAYSHLRYLYSSVCVRPVHKTTLIVLS